MSNPNATHADLPVLLGDEARSIDLDVTEKLGRVRVLESVATRIADAIDYHLPIERSANLMFVAGKGNNGANAMACARILYLRGWKNVALVPLLDPSDKDNLRPNIEEQLDLFNHFVGSSSLHPLDMEMIRSHEGVIIDGILGTGIDKPPRGVSGEAIQAMSENEASRVMSIDMPSGLNHVTGKAPGACVRATWTVNLHMLKSGQLEPSAKEYIGELWSVESALGYITFPGLLAEKFQSFYNGGPIQKVF